jgi:hypothetical protein
MPFKSNLFFNRLLSSIMHPDGSNGSNAWSNTAIPFMICSVTHLKPEVNRLVDHMRIYACRSHWSTEKANLQGAEGELNNT